MSVTKCIEERLKHILLIPNFFKNVSISQQSKVFEEAKSIMTMYYGVVKSSDSDSFDIVFQFASPAFEPIIQLFQVYVNRMEMVIKIQ